MFACPVYLAILVWVVGSRLLASCDAASLSSTTSTPSTPPSTPPSTTPTSSSTSTSQTSIATWTANYCQTQLEVFDVNHDGTLQESEQTEFFQSMLTSMSTLACSPEEIAVVKSTMIELCGSNCRFQHIEQAFCTVVARAMQGHCTEQNNNATIHGTTTTNNNNNNTNDINNSKSTTLHFYYTVAFRISDPTTYSLQDRQQWLITAFDQLAKTTWQAIRINPIRSQQQPEQKLRGPTKESRTWIAFNQSNIHHRNSNSSSKEFLSVIQSTNITSFLKLSGNDHWNVTHAVELHLTANTKYPYYHYRLETFSQRLQSQLPQILWDSLVLILPPDVSVILQQDSATTMPTVDTPDALNLYSQTQPPTSAPSHGIIPSPLADGLQIWLIVIIAVSGGLASGILYLVCFHARPKPCVSPHPHPSTNTGSQDDNQNQNQNNHSHTLVSITATESPIPNKGDGQPNTSTSGSATPDLINRSNHNNINNDNMKPIIVSTNTLATLDPTPPTTPIRETVSPEQVRSNSIQNNTTNPAQKPTDQERDEEEKVEEAAAPSTAGPRLSSTQRTLPKSSSRNIAYQIDPTGRIVPISFLSDRDSCLHVFEDASDVYSRRWSSSSSTSSSSSSSPLPNSRKKGYTLQGDETQPQHTLIPRDADGNDTTNHQEQGHVNHSIGVETVESFQPMDPTREMISQFSSDEHSSPTQLVDESSYYSGVYYGEDDCSDNDDDHHGFATHPQSHHENSHLFQEEMVVDPDVPVYGGVYYGSDGDEEAPAKARSSVPHTRSTPMVDYFAGIHLGQNASTSSISTMSKDHGHDGGEEWSVDSRRSRASSMMSAEEREWQRRLRDDLLHPVKEDAAIVDTTIVNLSGFTTGPTISNGRGETPQRGNRRRKER